MNEDTALARHRTDTRGEEEAMAGGPYLLGIDFGTGGVRVGIFDSGGTPVVFHSVEFETQHPRPGWAEQDPDEWWSCLVTATKKAMGESGVAAEEIVGLSVDSTSCTVLAMDKKDRHMRPAIMWMDVRASDQARRVQETGDPALKYNGYGAVCAEWMPSKALWLKENEPETIQQRQAHLRVSGLGDAQAHREVDGLHQQHEHPLVLRPEYRRMAGKPLQRRRPRRRSGEVSRERARHGHGGRGPSQRSGRGTGGSGAARTWPKGG
jgi:hypothetical protein